MDYLAIIWMIAGVLVFGSWMIFIIPVPTIITVITMVIIFIASRTKDKES